MSEPGSMRLIGTLGLAGLCAGLLLVGAYEMTLPSIEQNRAAAMRAAVFKVVPGSTALRKLTLPGGKDADAAMVYAAYTKDGAFAGYAIPASGPGFQDTIALIYGYDPARQRIIGMEVLESRETPGLGDKIFKDQGFVGEFKDLAVEPSITVVKRGTGKAPYEVDGITGATISSKAVVRIINQANAAWLSRLPPKPPEEAPR
jgi:H+/Na+-translocating ferredoxin:NAD+ oxidoreductase subunit G